MAYSKFYIYTDLTHGDTVDLLPAFNRVKNPDPGWADKVSAQDQARMEAGQGVSTQLAKDIAGWILEQAGRAMYGGLVGEWWHQQGKCKVICKRVADGRCWLIEKDKYAKLRIGTDDKAKGVYEGVHRLVCWIQHGPPRGGNDYATHVGRKQGGNKGWACRGHGKLCANPDHIRWGNARTNRKEYLDRRARGV